MTQTLVTENGLQNTAGCEKQGGARSAPRSHGVWSPLDSFRAVLAAGSGPVSRARNNLAREAVVQANENFGDH